MIDIAMLRDRKRELNLTNMQIAALSGVPFSTVNKVLSGETRNPRYETLQAIQEALLGHERGSDCEESEEGADSMQGVPGWVVDVVPAENSGYDSLTRRIRYERMGVREYWVIDSRKQEIHVYDFVNDSKARVYSFEEPVPAGGMEGITVYLKKAE